MSVRVDLTTILESGTMIGSLRRDLSCNGC